MRPGGVGCAGRRGRRWRQEEQLLYWLLVLAEPAALGRKGPWPTEGVRRTCPAVLQLGRPLERERDQTPFYGLHLCCTTFTTNAVTAFGSRREAVLSYGFKQPSQVPNPKPNMAPNNTAEPHGAICKEGCEHCCSRPHLLGRATQPGAGNTLENNGGGRYMLEICDIICLCCPGSPSTFQAVRATGKVACEASEDSQPSPTNTNPVADSIRPAGGWPKTS